MNNPVDDDTRGKVEYYRQCVLNYERLNDEIQKLIEAHNGSSENMSPEDVQHYRDLARQRDELMSEIRWLEQQLLDEE